MGCGASKDEGTAGGASAAQPAPKPTVAVSSATTPQATPSKTPEVAGNSGPAPSEPAPKKGGVGFQGEEGSTKEPSGVKINEEKPPKKKSAGFAEPEPEAEPKAEKPAKEKKGGGGLKFADGTKDDKEAKAHVPGTPFVKLGNTFDDLYDSEEEDSDEDSDEEPEKDEWDTKSVKSVKSEKPKKKKGGKIGFAADEEGHDGDEKSTLVPGTPFVKTGGMFDDLFDEDDEDSDSDSDEEKEEKAAEPAPEEEEKPKKKKKEGVGLKFSEDTKEGEDKPPRQPGTPFVKLGAFNDLYDEESDEDSDEDSDADDSPPPAPQVREAEANGDEGKKKKGGGGGVKFSSEAETAGDEKSTLVPGTPFVKLGATFDDLYDEDDDDSSDEDSDEDCSASKADSTPAAAEASAASDAPSGGKPDVASMSMDLPSIAKVRVA